MTLALVEVTWLDSSSCSGWHAMNEIPTKPLECRSAGYLVHKSRSSLVVALSASEARSRHGFGDTITIPRACVKKIRRLK